MAKSAVDLRVLDHFHSHLKMLETILEAVRLVPRFSTNVSTLKAPLFLVSDLKERFAKMAKELSPPNIHSQKPLKTEAAPQLGCYFCSRPFDPVAFHKVRVKVEGTTQDVAACNVCNQKLLSGKKAKVLFLAENGETVHWSKSKDYTPSAQFWGINEGDPSAPEIARGSGSHLTLVYSNVSKLSSSRHSE
jgi:hypothetical protein